jgi:hypothetical protein
MIKKTVLIFSILMNIYTTQCSDTTTAQTIHDSSIDVSSNYNNPLLKELQALKQAGNSTEYFNKKKSAYSFLKNEMNTSESVKKFVKTCNEQIYYTNLSLVYGG